MTEYNLYAGDNLVTFDSAKTFGITPVDGTVTDETVSACFNPELLLKWSEAVVEAYDSDYSVEVLFTPDGNMMAVKHSDEEQDIGIAVAHRIRDDDDNNDEEETDEETEEIETHFEVRTSKGAINEARETGNQARCGQYLARPVGVAGKIDLYKFEESVDMDPDGETDA